MVYGFDYRAPSVTGIVAKGTNTLIVSFDEKLDTDTINNIVPANFTYEKLSGGGIQTPVSAVLGSDGKSVVLTTPGTGTLTVADYVLVLGQAAPVKVKDVAGNGIYQQTEISFRPSATDLDVEVAPSLAKAEYNNGLGTLKLTLTKNTTLANLDATKLSINGVAITSDAVKTQTAPNVITLKLSDTNIAAVNAVSGALTLTSAKGAYTDGTTATDGESIAITKSTPAVIRTSSYSQESKVLTVTFDQPVTLGTSAIKVNSDAGVEATAAGSTAVNADGTAVSDLTAASATWRLKLVATEAAKIENDTTTKLNAYMTAGAVLNNDDAKTANIATTYATGGVAVTYTADTTNPFIQSVVFDDNANTLKLTFNENLDTNSAAIITSLKTAGALTIGTDATTNKVDLNGLTYGAGLANSSFVIDATNKKLLTITLGTIDAGTTATTFRSKLEAMNQSGKALKVSLAKGLVVDNNALKNIATTFDTGVVATFKDYSKPTLNAVSSEDVLSSNMIKLSFNEKVDKASAENVANYVITDGTGAQLTVSKVDLQDDGETAYLTTTVQEAGKPYNLAVKNVKDLASNIMVDDLTNAFVGSAKTITDKEEVSSAVATIGDNSKDDAITVGFSQKPNQTLALDKVNYAVLEHATADAADVWTNATAVDLTDATLTIDPADATASTVKIALGNYNLKDNKTYKVVVTNVTDIYGNALDSTMASHVTVPTISNAPVSVSNTELSGTTGSVTLVFDKELKNANVAANYSVGAATPTNATYTWDAIKQQATVVLDLATALTTTTPVTLTQTTGVTNITNLAGKGFANPIIPEPTGMIDTVAPKFATSNPVIATAYDQSAAAGTTETRSDKVVLTFSKTITQATAADERNYAVSVGGVILTNGSNIDAYTDLAAATNNQFVALQTAPNQVTIELSNETAKSVQFVKGDTISVTASNIQDSSANVMTTATLGTTAVSKDLATSTALTVGSTAFNSSNNITITLPDDILASSVNKNTFAINGNTVTSATVGTSKQIMLTLASPVAIGAGVQIGQGSNFALKDMEGNAIDATELFTNATGTPAYLPVSTNQVVGATNIDSATAVNATGSLAGTTKITYTKGASNTLYVKVSSAPLTCATGDTVPGSATSYTTATDITGADITTNKYVGLYEVNAQGIVQGFHNYDVSGDISLNLAGVTAADALGSSNDGKTIVTLPTLPTGATAYLYKLSGSAADVVIPAAGTVCNAAGGYVAATVGANTIPTTDTWKIAIAAVDATGKVVQFTNVAAVVTPNVAAKYGKSVGSIAITDDIAMAALTTSENTKTLTVTIDGVAKNYVINSTVLTQTDFLTALNAALGTAGTATISGTNLVVTSATTGLTSTVVFSGTAAIVGTPVVTNGDVAKN